MRYLIILHLYLIPLCQTLPSVKKDLRNQSPFDLEPRAIQFARVDQPKRRKLYLRTANEKGENGENKEVGQNKNVGENKDLGENKENKEVGIHNVTVNGENNGHNLHKLVKNANDEIMHLLRRLAQQDGLLTKTKVIERRQDTLNNRDVESESLQSIKERAKNERVISKQEQLKKEIEELKKKVKEAEREQRVKERELQELNKESGALLLLIPCLTLGVLGEQVLEVQSREKLLEEIRKKVDEADKEQNANEELQKLLDEMKKKAENAKIVKKTNTEKGLEKVKQSDGAEIKAIEHEGAQKELEVTTKKVEESNKDNIIKEANKEKEQDEIKKADVDKNQIVKEETSKATEQREEQKPKETRKDFQLFLDEEEDQEDTSSSSSSSSSSDMNGFHIRAESSEGGEDHNFNLDGAETI